MFVSCVRACEALRVSEAGVPNAGGSDGETSSSCAGFAFLFAGAISADFEGTSLIWETLAWVLKQIH